MVGKIAIAHNIDILDKNMAIEEILRISRHNKIIHNKIISSNQISNMFLWDDDSKLGWTFWNNIHKYIQESS